MIQREPSWEMAASKIRIPLKVVIHKQEERVLYAEANSDFADILFSFLTMPMGTIIRLLSNHSIITQPAVIGSFNNFTKASQISRTSILQQKHAKTCCWIHETQQKLCVQSWKWTLMILNPQSILLVIWFVSWKFWCICEHLQ